MNRSGHRRVGGPAQRRAGWQQRPHRTSRSAGYCFMSTLIAPAAHQARRRTGARAGSPPFVSRRPAGGSRGCVPVLLAGSAEWHVGRPGNAHPAVAAVDVDHQPAVRRATYPGSAPDSRANVTEQQPCRGYVGRVGFHRNDGRRHKLRHAEIGSFTTTWTLSGASVASWAGAARSRGDWRRRALTAASTVENVHTTGLQQPACKSPKPEPLVRPSVQSRVLQ